MSTFHDETDWERIATEVSILLSEHDEGANPMPALIEKHTHNVEVLDPMERIALSLERLVEFTRTDWTAFAGLVHADLETLMYAALFTIPAMIHADPGIDDEATASLIRKIHEIADLHRQQVRQAAGWKPHDENDA